MTEQPGPSPGLPSVTLVLGGARSGKSAFAEHLASLSGRPVLYVATAAIGDEEMRQRVERHRQRRPRTWRTLEAQRAVAPAIDAARRPGEVVIVEDLTLLASNYLIGPEYEPLENVDANEVQAALGREADALLVLPGPLIVVSNEVGMGLVPPYPLGRLFRDLLGWLNQRVAARADCVVLMVAGLPLALKGAGRLPVAATSWSGCG